MRQRWELQEVTIGTDNVIFSKERTEGVVVAKERTFELYTTIHVTSTSVHHMRYSSRIEQSCAMFAWDMDNENLEVLLLRIRVDMVNRRFVKGEIRSSMHMYVQSIPSKRNFNSHSHRTSILVTSIHGIDTPIFKVPVPLRVLDECLLEALLVRKRELRPVF